MSDNQDKVNQFQLLEQNMTNLAVQRQQFQRQLMEIESALGELKTTKQSYRILGNIMVQTDKEALRKELEEKQKTLDIRIKTLENQEGKLKEKAEKLQKDMLQEMQKE